jgi:3-hydroxyacyl-[acyl-carrier-protein] dehydratase
VDVAIGNLAGVWGEVMNYYFVDRILELVRGNRILTQWSVPRTAEYLDGNFPRFSRVPNSLIIESLADSAALLIFATTGFRSVPLLLMVNEAVFKKPAMPGDQMLLDVELASLHDGGAQLHGTTRVDHEEVAQSTLTLGLFQVREIADPQIRRAFSSLLQRCARFINEQNIAGESR